MPVLALLAVAPAVLAPTSAWSATKDVATNVQSLLKNKKCPKCTLAKADLNKADLKGADLMGANLDGANLKGADLRQANLEKASLEGALCRLTNFEGATMPDGKPFSIANDPKKYGCRK